MKKNSILLILLITIVLVPNITSALTNDLSDAKDHWANEYISNLVQDNIISGYPDGNFYPDNQIKVSEFTKIIINSRGEVVENPNAGEWYIPYVNKAKELGIIVEGEFNTYDRNITRAEVCRMVVRALNESASDGNTSFIDDDKIPEEFKGYVKKAVELNIVNGYPDNSFKPDNTVTRAEASKIIAVSRGREKNKQTKGTKPDKTEGDIPQEKIEQIISQLDKMVEDGQLTVEERDKLVEEIENGNIKNVKEIIGK
ncbi:S-layer homology domain-containing protein [Wukongibacter baidiensis]|uniref:S-layer homology domain-containing protein n=1 Tax=Wukongibacter baidiensis TaxID=1723361 RepID=UPI003D7FAA26